MFTGKTPGVYKETIKVTAPAPLVTGVPVFLGYGTAGTTNTAVPLTLASDLARNFGAPAANSYLALAVQGLFDNGGTLCYVVRLDDALDPVAALNSGLAAIAPLETIDLVCTPDLMRSPLQSQSILAMQLAVLNHCDQLGNRFAILDSPPATSPSALTVPAGMNGAMYYPWVQVGVNPATQAKIFSPPCGHVAGVYASTDRNIGVHKAPANVALSGVLDLEFNLTDADQGPLNEAGINCLRAFPGRGIRIWGARTLSRDPAWLYVSVRRLFITAGRWIERNTSSALFEPNDARLWVRITRELTAYFTTLFQQGALKGSTPDQAFYVKCDADTNPPEVRDAGRVVTEIGLAPARPDEFVIVRIIQSASGTTIAGPAAPA